MSCNSSRANFWSLKNSSNDHSPCHRRMCEERLTRSSFLRKQLIGLGEDLSRQPASVRFLRGGAYLVQPQVIHQKIYHLSLSLCFLAILAFRAYPQEDAKNSPPSKSRLTMLTEMLEGIPIGKDSRMFPYASLEDWFDPYGGLRLEHPAPWSQSDRVIQLFKFETFRDYSCKFRYLALSL